MREVAQQHRDLYSCGGFDLFIQPNSQDFFMNLAIPTSSDNWQVSIQEMLEICNKKNRRARLEYFDELYPDLKTALESAGFKQDMQAPVMVLASKDFKLQTIEKQGIYRRLQAHESDMLERALRQQSLAYGGTGDDNALVWLPSLVNGLANSSVLVAVLEKDDFVSGASIQIGAGIAELAGVWTHPNWQNRGFAFELCQHLISDYFAEGYDLLWLSAAEGAQRLYQKLGFSRLGTQLNYSYRS